MPTPQHHTRHHIVTLIHHPLGVALLQEAPDGVVVRFAHREIRFAVIDGLGPVFFGAVPVHPHAEADALIALNTGKFVHAVFAELHETGDARFAVSRHQVFDVAFALQTEFFLDFHFDP